MHGTPAQPRRPRGPVERNRDFGYGGVKALLSSMLPPERGTIVPDILGSADRRFMSPPDGHRRIGAHPMQSGRAVFALAITRDTPSSARARDRRRRRRWLPRLDRRRRR